MLSINFEINGENKRVDIIIYKNIKLGKKEILPKVLDTSIPFVLIRGDMIVNLFHLKVAIDRALKNDANNKMKTRSIESEIIYCLNPTTKINEGFQRFGLNDKPYPIVALKVNNEANELSLKEMEEILNPIFQSTPSQVEDIDSELKSITDYENLRKIYSLTNLNDIKDDDPAILNLIISTMAMKWHL